MPNEDEKFTMLYSPRENKVGCVLIQAVKGFTLPFWIPSNKWFLFPAPDQCVVTATRRQWEDQLNGKTNYGVKSIEQ